MSRAERQETKARCIKAIRESSVLEAIQLLVSLKLEDLESELRRVAEQLIMDDTVRPHAQALLGERRVLEELSRAFKGGDYGRTTTNGRTKG